MSATRRRAPASSSAEPLSRAPGSPTRAGRPSPARRRTPGARPLAAVLAALLLGALLAGCGVNFGAQTNQVYTPGQGVNDRSGSVDVLHALIVSESEGSGRFIAGLANNDRGTESQLTGIRGEGEDAAVVVSNQGGEDVVPAGGFLQLADEGSAVILVSGEGVEPGGYVRLTLSFSAGEDVTLNVPVVEPGEDFAEVEVPASGSADTLEE